MTSNSISSMVINKHKRNHSLFSCCTCSKTRKKPTKIQKREIIPIVNSQSNDLDIDSIVDIEITSTKPSNHEATPKSLASNNHSIATTNLSAYSTPSLLQKLHDKTQILDEYYRDMKPATLSTQSLTIRPYFQRRQSINSSRKSSRQLSENIISSQNSRFNLYRDEDQMFKELVRFNNDMDLILTRLDVQNDEHQDIDQIMRTDINELYIYSLLSNDIDRVRETALMKLLRMIPDIHNHDTITINKLNKLPKTITWKNKRVFGVPLRIYQQTTGHILPIGIQNAFEYVRIHAGKCDGLFRKPGAKSKIDELRRQIEFGNDQPIDIDQFNEYQPFVVADVIRQYFRELPECLIPPIITRLLCDSLKNFNEDEQLLAIRYVFLLLSDETREVLEIILRFLFDVSIRLGNTQSTYRSLARIFLPSIFQSYYNLPIMSNKTFWKKWKKEKADAVQQENERLLLEQCLISMIIHVDLLCRIPNSLTNELNLPTLKQSKRLNELVSDECNGEFDLKKYTTKKTEQFLQRLSNTKFKTIQTNLDDVHLSMYKSTEQNLPIWKCSIDIPNTTIKQVQQRILDEQFVWDNQFAEIHPIEQIDNDKEILQTVLNFQDQTPVRSFCEFRYSKKVSLNSNSNINSIVISSLSIDHSQNHFLPGIVGLTYDMHYYITPTTIHHPDHITVIQIASIDYSGRSSQWYENIYGSLLAQNLISLRDSFTKPQVFRV